MVVAEQVLLLLMFIGIGYILRKVNLVPEDTANALSKILIYVFCPALTFNTFSKQFKVSNLLYNSKVIITSTIVVFFLIILGKLLARLFTKDTYTKGVYSYTFTSANFGYMGYALVQSLYGDNLLLQMMVFTIPLSIYIYTEGYRVLIGNAKISLKNIINPGIIAIIIGIIFGLVEIPIPGFIFDLLTKAGNCMSPVSMIMTGIVIAEYKIKDIIFEKKAYIVSFLRLIAIPFTIGLALSLFKVNTNIILMSTITFMMPAGLNTIVFPKLVNRDCKLGASFAVVSTVLALITIPLMLEIINMLFI